jgi:nitrogenase subunit NifH
MCDEIHLKTKFKMTREIIENYIKSLNTKELEKIIKENKMQKRRQKKKSIIRGDAKLIKEE